MRYIPTSILHLYLYLIYTLIYFKFHLFFSTLWQWIPVFQPPGFINLCDKVREAQVAVDRKRAGFSEAWRDAATRSQEMPRKCWE